MTARGVPFQKNNKFGVGGARPGSGPKASPKTLLSRLAIKELDEEAEKSIHFMVKVRDDLMHPIAVRVHCAENLIDRRFGKPKQTTEIEGSIDLSADKLLEILHKERVRRGLEHE